MLKLNGEDKMLKSPKSMIYKGFFSKILRIGNQDLTITSKYVKLTLRRKS